MLRRNMVEVKVPPRRCAHLARRQNPGIPDFPAVFPGEHCDVRRPDAIRL